MVSVKRYSEPSTEVEGMSAISSVQPSAKANGMAASFVNPLDISEIIVYKKRKAELLFKKGYLIWKGSENKDAIQFIDSELKEVDSKLKELEKRIDNFSIVLPNQEKLDSLNEQLSSFEEQELYEAMKSKEGNVFELLRKKGELLREMLEKKEEIAKLNIFLQNFKGKEKEDILSLIKNKDNFSESLILKIKDKKSQLELFVLFSRLGFQVSKENLPSEEKKVFIGTKAVWVPIAMLPEVDDLNKNLEEFSRKIQYINAQKQIKVFSDFEEKEFQSLQNKYLSLLKEQDKILDNFGKS